MTQMPKVAYALRCSLASKQQGKDSWFRFQTRIGPCHTLEASERALFETREDAMNTSAFRNPMSFFEPVEVTDGLGNYDWNAK